MTSGSKGERTRRHFLASALAAVSLPPAAGVLLSAGGCSSTAARASRNGRYSRPFVERPREPAMLLDAGVLPLPDLSEARIVKNVAGIRPYRRGSIRLEVERFADRIIVQNYGHGGAGITLSWGCAEEVARLVERSFDAGKRCEVAVLGAGVNGLSCALEMRSRGFDVTVYADAFSPETTSNVAAGQWAPSLVATSSPLDDPCRFERILRTAHRRFTALNGIEWGVSHCPNYQTGRGGAGLFRIPDDLVAGVRLARLPLSGRARSGSVYHTMLIEPPIYMPRLHHEVEEAGARFKQQRFATMSEVFELPQRIIVNCMGLGAGDVCQDSSIVPVRGQLVHLDPQDLGYMFSHDGGAMFPRRDALVLGGTMEYNRTTATPDADSCRAIVVRHREFFAAGA
ncbi:MAG: FAD-dependent oxidoreductase [Phycisphaerales bacterium]